MVSFVLSFSCTLVNLSSHFRSPAMAPMKAMKTMKAMKKPAAMKAMKAMKKLATMKAVKAKTKMWCIRVLTSNGQSFKMKFAGDTELNIKEVKSKIQFLKGIPPAEQRLYFGFMPCNDRDRVSSYGITACHSASCIVMALLRKPSQDIFRI